MAEKGWPVPIAWSPDSNRLLVLLRDGSGSQSEYSFISIDDGSRARVKAFPAGSEAMPVGGSISPDGRYLAYSVRSADPAIRGIFVMGTDGQREVPLVQGVANEESPFWTPDGRGIVFASDRSGTLDLWLIRVADGKPQSSPQLLRANIGEIAMGIARDGSYYYGTRSQEDDVYIAEIDPKSLEIISEPRQASENSRGRNIHPEWAPDGQSIAFGGAQSSRGSDLGWAVRRTL